MNNSILSIGLAKLESELETMKALRAINFTKKVDWTLNTRLQREFAEIIIEVDGRLRDSGSDKIPSELFTDLQNELIKNIIELEHHLNDTYHENLILFIAY